MFLTPTYQTAISFLLQRPSQQPLVQERARQILLAVTLASLGVMIIRDHLCYAKDLQVER